MSGLLAVLVAFAAGGPGLALATLAVVLAVQQLEGNVLHPLIMGRVIRLPAFVILLAVAIGSALVGVLGAFLAVPVAASIARILEHVTDEKIETTPGGRGRSGPTAGGGPRDDAQLRDGGVVGACGPGYRPSAPKPDGR